MVNNLKKRKEGNVRNAWVENESKRAVVFVFEKEVFVFEKTKTG